MNEHSTSYGFMRAAYPALAESSESVSSLSVYMQTTLEDMAFCTVQLVLLNFSGGICGDSCIRRGHRGN